MPACEYFPNCDEGSYNTWKCPVKKNLQVVLLLQERIGACEEVLDVWVRLPIVEGVQDNRRQAQGDPIRSRRCSGHGWLSPRSNPDERKAHQ
jgi:hypothetical protein